jgi:hypothetical protein
MYDEQTRRSFVELGDTMRKYVIVQLALMVVSFLMAGTMFSIMFSFNHIGPRVFMGFGVFVVILLILSIMILVYFLKYLSALKRVALATHDLKLEKSYKMQLWGFLLPIIGSIIGILIVMGSISLFINEMMVLYETDSPASIEGMNAIIPMVITQMNSVDFYMPRTLMLIIPAIFLMIIFGIIGLVLNIMGIMAFEEWSNNYFRMTSNSQSAYRITKGTELMKWGYILQIFTAVIGTIVYLIGVYHTGTSIKEEFGSLLNQNEILYPNPPVQPTTISQNSEQKYPKFCMHCGSPINGGFAKFCSNCGKEIERD